MNKVLFINAKLKSNDKKSDVLVENGIIKDIGENLSFKYGEDIKVVDIEGNLMVPPYVEPHIHLDYVYTALHQELPILQEHYLKGYKDALILKLT